MKVAIVGSGIAGLGAAYALRGRADVTLYEAGSYFGGHANTVDITLPDATGKPVTHGVDTGFLVFNERTYPQLIELFADLKVATSKSDMSFSVKVPGAFGGQSLEWSGSSLNSVFAQRANLARPAFLRMLRQLLRFNEQATRLAVAGKDAEMMQPLGEFLDAQGFGREFRDWYLLPMLGCIWSCPTDQMLRFPVATMIRFCHNHGLIQVNDRPQWWTVRGGAKHYVEKIVAGIPDRHLDTPVRRITRDLKGVDIATDAGTRRFDKVVLATHPGQALAMLADPGTHETATLGAIRYHPNRAVLHTDTSVLPERRLAWAAWNYERAADAGTESGRVCLHYLINRLQPLPWTTPVVVSLNPVRPIERNSIMGEFDYEHPVFDLAAIRAQEAMPQLQGHENTWYCGAWMGYGFHEDGLKAGQRVARQILIDGERDAAGLDTVELEAA